ncbi:potassium voltage-gated channel Eag-related subfamily H member 8, partial [Paragonimus westermani]
MNTTVLNSNYFLNTSLPSALMHAAVFGNLTAIIQRIYARRTAFQSKTQDLKDFVRVHHIPKPLKRRMEDFFQTTWAINRGIDVSEIIDFYPEELRRDIALHLNRDLLSLKVFENASQDCLKSLAVEIKTTFFTPGEYLIHAGDVLRRLYFVCNGSLEVLDNDEVVALLGKNDWFGTYIDTSAETMQTVRSRCGVKSLTYCDLQSIDLVTLNNVLDQYPKFKSEFVAYLYEDLSFDIQEGAEKSLDSDAILVPAITLQPMHGQNQSGEPKHLNTSVHFTASETQPQPSDCASSDLEAGVFTSNKRKQEGSTARSSSPNGMRYYPRRPMQSMRRSSNNQGLRRATLGAIFSGYNSSKVEGSKLKIKKKPWRTDLLKSARGDLTKRQDSFSSRRHTLPVVHISMADEEDGKNDGLGTNTSDFTETQEDAVGVTYTHGFDVISIGQDSRTTSNFYRQLWGSAISLYRNLHEEDRELRRSSCLDISNRNQTSSSVQTSERSDSTLLRKISSSEPNSMVVHVDLTAGKCGIEDAECLN